MISKMNALVLESIGSLKYKQVDKPSPKRNEVLLKIKDCGICSSDIPRIFTTGTYHFPTIPGHEFAGIVEEVGENVDVSLIGRRAAVFPLLPCFECEPCRNKQYAQCRKYSYFGSRCNGAYAEYLAVPVWNLVTFSDKLDYELGALCEPLAVALHSFNSIDSSDTKTSIAIIGTGTIGFFIGIIAKINGFDNVIMCGRNKAKIEFAQSLGFKTADTSSECYEDQINKLTDDSKAKYVFECVGSPESINCSIRTCAAMGTVVLVGNPTGNIEFDKNTYWKILRQQITVKGVWNSSYNDKQNDWKEAILLLEKYGDDFRRLITDTYPLSEAEQALSEIKNPDKFSLKVMFKI